MGWKELFEGFNKKQSDYALWPLHDDGGEPMAEYMTIRDGFGNLINERRVRDVPWSTTPVATATKAWKRKKEIADAFLADIGVPHRVDEIALLFADDKKRVAWVRDAVSEPGVKLFNSSWDSVHTSPIPSQYTVEYDFLEVPNLGMRIEAMRIDRGISPLHESLLNPWTNPTVNEAGDFGVTAVHLSFKCRRDEYEGICAEMVLDGAERVQECHSTYGQFSYYRIPVDDFGVNLYLKPRINLRDEEAEVPDTTKQDFGHPGVGGKYSPEGLGLRPIRDTPQA